MKNKLIFTISIKEQSFEMKKITLFFLLLILSNLSKADIYRAKHDDVWKMISPEIDKILIFHDLCKNSNDCGKKQLFFLESGKNALYISLYSTTDLKIIQDIIDSVFLVYKRNKASASIELSVYKENHPVNINIFKRIFTENEPFLTMSIKGK